LYRLYRIVSAPPDNRAGRGPQHAGDRHYNLAKALGDDRIKELVENIPDLAALVECSLSDGRFANSSASCIAACWPSSGMTRYAGA
jgi:hypothetical protein